MNFLETREFRLWGFVTDLKMLMESLKFQFPFLSCHKPPWLLGRPDVQSSFRQWKGTRKMFDINTIHYLLISVQVCFRLSRISFNHHRVFFFSFFEKFYWSIVDLQCYKFLLYSKVNWLYIYICSFLCRFFSRINYYRALSRVPCAI